MTYYRATSEGQIEMTPDEIAEFEASRGPAHDPIPDMVTMRQARAALLESGLLQSVNAAIAGMPGNDGDLARISWEYSQHVERNWPLVSMLRASLGLTESQINNLFVSASKL